MTTTAFTDGVTLTAAAWFNDVDTAAYSYLTSVAGTNTVTATGPASMTAYAAGQVFRFLPAATNTGATNLNITPSGSSALGAKNVYWNSAACVGGELRQNVPIAVMYDGTQFQVIGSASAVQVKGATLTANRIPYAVGSSSLLQDSANLTFNGTTLVLTGAQTISSTLGVTGQISCGSAITMGGGRSAGTIAASANADITSSGGGANAGIAIVQGGDGTNEFLDVISYRYFGGAPGTIIKYNSTGSPATRTYTITGGTGEVNLAMGAGNGPYVIKTFTLLPNA